jgi:hypothetical protein
MKHLYYQQKEQGKSHGGQGWWHELFNTMKFAS